MLDLHNRQNLSQIDPGVFGEMGFKEKLCENYQNFTHSRFF